MRSQPVLWQLAAINLAIAAVNLTPLLELDGYYILMDLLERPRLRAQSGAWLLSPKFRRENLPEMACLAASLLSVVPVVALLSVFF
jgi:putative peptide zinc metalloprotease protein